MIDISLWVLVVVLSLFAAKMTVPKPPTLEWERFFNVSLATIVRGSLEKDGAEFSDWVARMGSLIGAEEDSELFDDPHLLGEDYSVEKALGRACSWEKVAEWTDEVHSSISLRASELIWVSLGGVGALLDLNEQLPSLHIIDDGGDIASELSGCLDSASDRLVIFVAGSAT